MTFSQALVGGCEKQMELYPVVLEHAAAFLKRSPWDVSRDARLLAGAHLAAHRVYGQSPIVVGVDVYNVEVEAWGATLGRSSELAVPTVAGPVCESVEQIHRLPDLDLGRDGRLPLLIDAAEDVRQNSTAAVHVPLAGPFAMASALLGHEMALLELMDEPTAMAVTLERLAHHQARLVREIIARGFGVTVYESGASPPMVSPELFRQFIAPALRIVCQAGSVECVMGGDTATVADALLDAGPVAVICPHETDQARFMAGAVRYPGIRVRINIPLAQLAGDEPALRSQIERAVILAAGHPCATVGTGVLSYGQRPELVLQIRRWVEELSQR